MWQKQRVCCLEMFCKKKYSKMFDSHLNYNDLFKRDFILYFEKFNLEPHFILYYVYKMYICTYTYIIYICVCVSHFRKQISVYFPRHKSKHINNLYLSLSTNLMQAMDSLCLPRHKEIVVLYVLWKLFLFLTATFFIAFHFQYFIPLTAHNIE